MQPENQTTEWYITLIIKPDLLLLLLTWNTYPSISYHSLKKSEMEVGENIEQVTQSCSNHAVEDEKFMTRIKIIFIVIWSA